MDGLMTAWIFYCLWLLGVEWTEF